MIIPGTRTRLQGVFARHESQGVMNRGEAYQLSHVYAELLFAVLR